MLLSEPYLHTCTMSWVNGDILCSGGTITGSNFEITNEAKLLRLQNSLKIENFEKSARLKVFPNPISTGALLSRRNEPEGKCY